jgi:peroxiredoxin Q/BCP
VIGASTDTPETQREFAESLAVPYPMVGDVDRRLTSSFDVLWPLIRVSRRVTYVIDHAGMIRGVFPFELKEEKHIEETLRLLDTLERERKQSSAKA